MREFGDKKQRITYNSDVKSYNHFSEHYGDVYIIQASF